nr:neuroligin-4, Y-linked-like [Penaeus vannamei]
MCPMVNLFVSVPKDIERIDKLYSQFNNTTNQRCHAANDRHPSFLPANKHEQHPFPVMVYIHGESYEWNSGNPYDGSVLAASGRVVVVTVNYRLGVLGDIKPDPHQRSITNYGLMDQIAALHWLKENIAEFGGDPDNVTMFGHGTGAACINFLMISPPAPDPKLFHRAILMSGSSLAPWALVSDPFKNTRRIAQALNCSDVPLGDELKKCLRVKNLHQIMQAQSEVM